MIGAMKRPVCLFLIAVCKTRGCYGNRMITVFGFPGRRFPCYRTVRKVLNCSFRRLRLLIVMQAVLCGISRMCRLPS